MSERDAGAVQRELSAAGCRDADGCADADTLLAFAEGRLDAAARDAVAARVTACARCAAALRVALDAADWATDLSAHLARVGHDELTRAKPPARRSRRRAALPMALAASVVLLFAASLLLRPPPRDEPLRGRPLIASTPADGAVLQQAPAELGWPCELAPTAAKVELLGADATPRWSGAVIACAATLPPATRAALVPGAYLWRVKNAAGDVLLGPIAFRIAR